MEQRPIPGFEGYLISDTGVVTSRHGRPLSFYLDKDGYRRVSMAMDRGKDAKRVHCGIHQLVCLVFNGPNPGSMQVRHLDGSKDNNTPSNLTWGTHLANMRDKHKHGTMPKGVTHPMVKLSEDQVREIRILVAVPHKRKSAFSDRQIALQFGVNVSTVRLIRLNRAWRHLNAA